MLSVSTIVVLAAACGSGQTTERPRAVDVPDTVTLGRLPEPLSSPGTIPVPPTTPRTTAAPTTVALPEPIAGAVADAVVGYRVLLVGDTVLASTAPRNDGIMCDVLTSFGWTVEIAAERGRFVEFGHEVLDRRLETGDDELWDVAAVMFGNHFDGDQLAFERQLEGLLDRLAPRPTLVYTVSELDDDAVAINEVIRELPQAYPGVVVIDWAEATAEDVGEMFEDDGPELTEEGSGVLVLYTAAALGKTPGGERGEPGECLPSVFVDDSAIVL